MSSSFHDFPLREDVQKALDEMGYETPTKVQARSIPELLEGRDMLAQAPTGTGKTAAFGIAIIHAIQPGEGLQALVLTPTRELCEQVNTELRRLTKHSKLRVAPIYGGVSYNPQLQALRDGVEIIVGTPGRVMDHMRQGNMKLNNLRVFTLDEADRMMDMGFITDIEWVHERSPSDAQQLLFSATIPYEIELLAQQFCHDPIVVNVDLSEEFEDRRVELVMEVGGKNKPWALHRILENEQADLAFVFCRTRRTADKLAKLLKKHNYNAKALHGDMSQAHRERVMDAVRKGTVNVVVATDVLARGIDVRMCDLVVNYDPPEEADAYVHRVGRTARMGDVGKAVTLMTRDDARTILEIEGHAGAKLTRAEVPETDSKDRITRREDWSMWADPVGMVHFRLRGKGVQDRSRMDVFWALMETLDVRENDLGQVHADGDGYRLEVPEQLAGTVQRTLQSRGLGGVEVDVEAIKPEK